MEITKEKLKELILQGLTIKQLQEYFDNCSRSKITEHKRLFGLVGLTPNSKKVDRGSGHKTCPTCKEIKSLSEFYSNGSTATGLVKLKPSCKTCENLDRKINFYSLIEEYLQIRNTTYMCSNCGDTDKYGFLEFHHREPHIKDFNIGSISKSISEETFATVVVPELDKCILLCPSCHKREHILMGAN